MCGYSFVWSSTSEKKDCVVKNLLSCIDVDKIMNDQQVLNLEQKYKFASDKPVRQSFGICQKETLNFIMLKYNPDGHVSKEFKY